MECCTKCGMMIPEEDSVINVKGQKFCFNCSVSERIANHKYSMLKFKKIVSLLMIFVTLLASVTGLIAVLPLAENHTDAVGYAGVISRITSQAGNTITEAFYQDYGNYLEEMATIHYITVCTIGGFYQFVLGIAFWYWIYVFKKSSFQKKLFDTTGKFE